MKFKRSNFKQFESTRLYGGIQYRKDFPNGFGCDYVFTGHGTKPWLVIGNHDQRLTFERWMVDLSVNKH